LKILLVDDEPSVRKLIRISLERAGYAIVEAGNGQEALSKFSEDVNLVLTDIIMPQMNGLELARRVGESHPDLPILFMSGFNEEFHGLAPVQYLQKPFDIGVRLVEEVRQTLARCMS